MRRQCRKRKPNLHPAVASLPRDRVPPLLRQRSPAAVVVPLEGLVHVPVLEDLLHGDAARRAVPVVPHRVVVPELVLRPQRLHVRLPPLRHHRVHAHLQGLHRLLPHRQPTAQDRGSWTEEKTFSSALCLRNKTISPYFPLGKGFLATYYFTK